MDNDANTNLIIILMVLLIGFFIYVRQTESNNTRDTRNTYSTRESTSANPNTEGFCSNSHKRNYTVDSDGDSFDLTGSDDLDTESLLSLDDDERQKIRYMVGDRPPVCGTDDGRSFDLVRVCDEFIDTQYHKDYNDTITAINNLTSQKELFNMGFLPVREVEPDPDNVDELVNLFLERLNDEVRHRVAEYLNPNSGWNDQGKQKKIKSGFEEQMEELGLPGDLYTQPADKAKVRLVRIEKAEQHMTDDQIRFVITIIVQKKNVKDQMVLKVHYFMEKEDLKSGGDDRDDFFKKSVANHQKEELNNLVIIEQIFTVGFMSDTGTAKTRMDKFYEYKDVMNQDGIIDQYKVLQIMKKKHAERSRELSSFLCSVDDDTKALHDVPGIGNYEAHENTRTIMDDLRVNPQRSFGRVTM